MDVQAKYRDALQDAGISAETRFDVANNDEHWSAHWEAMKVFSKETENSDDKLSHLFPTKAMCDENSQMIKTNPDRRRELGYQLYLAALSTKVLQDLIEASYGSSGE